MVLLCPFPLAPFPAASSGNGSSEPGGSDPSHAARSQELSLIQCWVSGGGGGPQKLPAQLLGASAALPLLIPWDLCPVGLGQQEPDPAWRKEVFCSPEGQICSQRGPRRCQERREQLPALHLLPSHTGSPSPTCLSQDLTVLGVHPGTSGRCHLPSGPPRRGWVMWDGSRMHHSSKNNLSCSRLTQMSAAWPCILPAQPSPAPCLAFPCSQAGITGRKGGQARLSVHR